jgi:hypothetical protein
MEVYGFCLVEKTPLDEDSMRRFFDKIEVLRNTLPHHRKGKGRECDNYIHVLSIHISVP